MTYELKTYSHISQELFDAWQHLEKSAPITIFQSYEWCREWCNCMADYLKDTKPYFILVFHNCKPVALAPLQVYKNFLYSRVDFLGSRLNDYNSIIFDKEVAKAPKSQIEIFDIIVAHLRKFDVILFGNVPEVIHDHPNNLIRISKFKQAMYALRVNASQQSLNAFVPRKIRKQNTRLLKKLNEVNRVKYNGRVVNEERDNIIDFIIREKSKQYLSTGAVNIFNSNMINKFIRRIALNENLVILSSIYVGGDIIAAHLGFQKGDYFYYYLPVHGGRKYARYSPGSILLQYLMENGSDGGLRFFDFTVGEEAYKTRWANEKITLYEYNRANSLVGNLVLIGIKLRNYIKRNQNLRKVFMQTRSVAYSFSKKTVKQ